MFRQVSSYFVANLVAALFGFASVVLFTRTLTPHEYGIYILGISAASFLSAALFGWIKASVLRISAEAGGTDVRLATGYSFLFLLPAIPILTIGALLVAPETSDYFLPAVLLAFTIGFFEFYQELFRATQRSTPYMTATITRAALALLLSSFFVLFLDLGGRGLLFGIAASYVVASLLYAFVVWERPIRSFDSGLLTEMLRFGLPMALSGAIFMLQAILDRVVVGAYLGEHSAGVYGAAADLVRQVMLFPGVAIGSAVLPIAISLMGKADRAAVDRHLLDSLEMLLGVMAPTTVGLAIIAGKLSHLVLGPSFQATATALIPIIVFGWLLRSLSYQFVHVSYQLDKKPMLLTLCGGGTLIASVIAMVILIPRYQLAGAAWAMLVSELFGLALGYALSARAYRLPMDLRLIGRITLATLLMAVPTVLVDRQFAPGGVLAIALPVMTGILTYGLAAYGLDIAGIRTKGEAFVVTRRARSIIHRNKPPDG